MDAQTKISRSVIQLVANHAFYGSSALKLNIRETTDFDTMCTDGSNILWNKDFVDKCNEGQTKGTIVHEVYHVILMHHLRMGNRTPKKWNIACDLAINPLIKAEGFELPEGALLETEYEGMSAEEIYDVIDDDYYEEPQWGGVFPMTDENGKPLTGEAREAAIDEVKQMIASAAEEAKKAGQEINGTLKDLVKNVRTPQVNWKSFLTTYLINRNPEDASWKRPNRKMLSDLDMYMPAMISENLGVISIILDTSASVSKKEREVFLSELQSINESLKPTNMHVICVDTNVATCFTFSPYEDITELELQGGGGTDMSPGFKYIEECLPETETILCFSDCEFWDWPKEPDKPVLWLSTGNNTENPYGTLVSVKF